MFFYINKCKFNKIASFLKYKINKILKKDEINYFQEFFFFAKKNIFTEFDVFFFNFLIVFFGFKLEN
jgi:hypothetical protein